MIASLLAVAVLAQADAGRRWPQHPRIVAVREVVADIDRQVTDAGTTWACAMSSTADAPKSFAALDQVRVADAYAPSYETLEINRAVAGDLERVTWRWELHGVSETQITETATLTRWSRQGREVFVHLGQGLNSLGWSALEVRAWSDAEGARFWWATSADGSEGKSERVGPKADSSSQAWVTPEKTFGYLRPCTPKQLTRIRELAESGELVPADFPLIKAMWVKRKPR